MRAASRPQAARRMLRPTAAADAAPPHAAHVLPLQAGRAACGAAGRANKAWPARPLALHGRTSTAAPHLSRAGAPRRPAAATRVPAPPKPRSNCGAPLRRTCQHHSTKHRRPAAAAGRAAAAHESAAHRLTPACGSCVFGEHPPLPPGPPAPESTCAPSPKPRRSQLNPAKHCAAKPRARAPARAAPRRRGARRGGALERCVLGRALPLAASPCAPVPRGDTGTPRVCRRLQHSLAGGPTKRRLALLQSRRCRPAGLLNILQTARHGVTVHRLRVRWVSGWRRTQGIGVHALCCRQCCQKGSIYSGAGSAT